MKYLDEFRDSKALAALRDKIRVLAEALGGRKVKIMEVCGTHTMAIARYGIRDLLPENIELISGPGCPVCVTDAGYLDAAIDLAEQGKIIATFGDMVQVPGSEKKLTSVRAGGGQVKVCHTPINALDLARQNPNQEVVFLAVGFETTIAPVISLIDLASRENINNLSLLVAFKLVPPALYALLADPEVAIDAFLCPAHVSAIIGARAYEPFAGKGIPCVIAGFEPLDILYGLLGILEQLDKGESQVDNQYSRVVKEDGNTKAQEIIAKYLEPADTDWRGMGSIPGSGMKLREEYAKFDAEKRFDLVILPGRPDSRCRCGQVLKGVIKPLDCPLFGTGCNPSNPVGPCMVSSEGSCSAYFKFARGKTA